MTRRFRRMHLGILRLLVVISVLPASCGIVVALINWAVESYNYKREVLRVENANRNYYQQLSRWEDSVIRHLRENEPGFTNVVDDELRDFIRSSVRNSDPSFHSLLQMHPQPKLIPVPTDDSTLFLLAIPAIIASLVAFWGVVRVYLWVFDGFLANSESADGS